MSEQKIILTKMQTLIMNILKNGTASEEEASQLDSLEASLQNQPCFKSSEDPQYALLGEEVTALVQSGKLENAADLLNTHDISAEDYLDFIDYHFEDEEEIEDIDDDVRAALTQACAKALS